MILLVRFIEANSVNGLNLDSFRVSEKMHAVIEGFAGNMGNIL